jgi:50S ribosomal protein L16 3-hydroxylase
MNSDPKMQLSHFDTTAFLRDTWQKKPLLIRNPWAQWANPLGPDELGGLACEDGIESRLIMRVAAQGTAADWAVENGPFAETRFGEIGSIPWTLLVQAVDHHDAGVAALITPFRFIPDWRIDDVMVSYATDGGGVGPHFDQYDVFLIQGLGQRRWRLGGRCDESTALLPHDDLRLISHFEATDEWLLGPGDILYVPPRIAHNGVAVGEDCMTYSIGFRAPSRAELIADFADDVALQLDDNDRYSDPGLSPQSHPGEITAQAIDALHRMVTEKLADRAAFARWFGGYNSMRKFAEIDFAPDESVGVDDVRAMIAQGAVLNRNPASRFSFIRQDGNTLLLCVDGECFDFSAEDAALAEMLCAGDYITVSTQIAQSDGATALLVRLINQGSLAFEDAG